jgi:arsenate reductase-like glutaredoxin family protein
MNPKEREKRIDELRTLITIQSAIMESLSRKRGDYFIELNKLEAEQIHNETELETLQRAA